MRELYIYIYIYIETVLIVTESLCGFVVADKLPWH